MKKLISIDGWNPEGLRTGDRVVCITRTATGFALHTGVVGLGYSYPEEEEKRREINKNSLEYHGWYVIDDISGKKLYPYTQDTCLIKPGNNSVKYVTSQIVEVE